MTSKKAIAYIDGNNLYHGIIDRRNIPTKGHEPFSKERPWGDLLWLNLEAFIRAYNFPDADLIKIKFFQALSFKPASKTRQQLYMNALHSLGTIDDSSFFYGEFKPIAMRCKKCGYEYIHHTEKKTDAAISTEILSDFYTNNCEVTIIIGGDSDQIPVIEKIKSLRAEHNIYVIFPPGRRSKAITNILGKEYCRNINYQKLLKNQFADKVIVNGYEITKPEEYQRF